MNTNPTTGRVPAAPHSERREREKRPGTQTKYQRADPAKAPSSRQTNRLTERIVRWITRRHAADGLRARLTRDRLYILPTTAGGLFALLIIALLAGSINYANNLAFLLTFLVFGVAHNALWYTHRNLAHLVVEAPPKIRGFAGEPITGLWTLIEPDGRPRDGLILRSVHPTNRKSHYHAPLTPSMRHTCRLTAHGRCRAVASLAPLSRGLHKLPRLAIETRHPLGLLRCWSWLHFDTELIVSPHPRPPLEHEPPPLARTDDDATHAGRTNADESGEADEVRDYRAGDPIARIAWKPSARLDRWLLRDTTPQVANSVWLALAQQPGSGLEERLERLAGWVEHWGAEGRRFGLLLPDARIEPGHGPEHLDACRDALAACGQKAMT